VQPDEVIGSVGVTGGRSKPASYFGIRHKGRPVDPQRWCRRGKGNRVGS
jgi:septal ring factor EnvC (AmiA/AmiB activator)